MKKGRQVYWTLFRSTFYLSAFTFGGGYVIVPLMKKKFADELKWIDEKEMMDLIAIAQASPGPLAVNVSTMMGYRVAGYPGALISILGTVLPPFITLSVVSLFYTQFRENVVVQSILKGMQAGVAAIIADVVLNMGTAVLKGKKAVSGAVMAGTFIASYFFKVNVIFIIGICICLGIVLFLYDRKKRKEGE